MLKKICLDNLFKLVYRFVVAFYERKMKYTKLNESVNFESSIIPMEHK